MATFIEQKDLPIAEKDTTVTVELAGVNVQRKVMAGSRVPPDLIDAYNEASKTTRAPAKKPAAKSATEDG